MICPRCLHTHRDGMTPVEVCVHIIFENAGVRYCNCPGEPKLEVGTDQES